MLEVLARTTSAPRAPRACPGGASSALHALRNALIPVITVIGLQVGVLFTGAILTETIFSWPGVGKWLIEAINRATTRCRAACCCSDVIVMIVNLLVDLTYGFINPRIRHAMSSACTSPTPDHQIPTPLGGGATPPIPLREFWGYFSAKPGRRRRLVVTAVMLPSRCSPTCSRRTRPISPTTTPS